jgi:cell wall-associated NlpC family hydrolase
VSLAPALSDMTAIYDPRVTPARADLAASELRGHIEAERYADGQLFQAVASSTGIRRTPSAHSEQMNQLLFGETVILYDTRDGWGWGRSLHDGYVGWLALRDLEAPALETTMRVRELRSILYAEPHLRAPALMSAPMNARLSITGVDGDFLREARGGWVVSDHLSPVGAVGGDYVDVAMKFLGAPYLWGGRCSLGLDCSGLVQTALGAVGVIAPRDSDMQRATLGRVLTSGESGRRGDLIFWKGHVAILVDSDTVLHADSRRMQVCLEPLSMAAAERMKVPDAFQTIHRLDDGV